MEKVRFSEFSALLIMIMALTLTFCVNAQVINEHYIITFNDTVRTPAVEASNMARANGFNVGHVYSFALKGFSARIPDAALSALQRNPRIASIEPDILMQAFAQTTPTGVARINANNVGISEVNVDIAIIDSGIDIDHPDLNVVGGVRFYSRFGMLPRQDSNYDDDNGHGTHVAGSAAAKNNDFGVVGVAPGARLWAIKVLDKNGSGYLSDIIAGIDWITANANIIEVANMSLGGLGLSNAYRTAIANSVAAGIVYVAAAGNASMDIYGNDGVFNSVSDVIPAAYPEVMTISAMADSDGLPGGLGLPTAYGSYPDDSFALFSNYSKSVVANNPVNSLGKAIDLIMPGVSIYSTVPGGGYGTGSGTSMASPHAAGLAALYIAQNGRAYNAAQVYAIRQALIDSGMDQASEKRLAHPDTELDIYPENLGWAKPGEIPEDEKMHVASIDMSGKSSILKRWAASATIQVVDANNAPVGNALLYGAWSGAYNSNVSGNTNSNGLVTFSTNWVKNGGTFTFTVNNIVKTGWIYDSSANVETSDTIILPPPGAPEFVRETVMESPFPSPGNPEMWIPFNLSETEDVTIRIYDLSGRLVRTLDIGLTPSGSYLSKEKAAYWDGKNNSGEEINSGIYFCVMETGNFRASKKVMIIK